MRSENVRNLYNTQRRDVSLCVRMRTCAQRGQAELPVSWKQVNEDPMLTKLLLTLLAKVPGGIGPSDRLSSPAFSSQFF